LSCSQLTPGFIFGFQKRLDNLQNMRRRWTAQLFSASCFLLEKNLSTALFFNIHLSNIFSKMSGGGISHNVLPFGLLLYTLIYFLKLFINYTFIFIKFYF
jgi:hypothetical protein